MNSAKSRYSSSRLAGDALWVLAGQVASALGALVTVRILTEVLSKSGFGEFSLLVGLTALALNLTATPRLQGLLRYYPEYSAAHQLRQLRIASVRSTAFAVIVAALILIVLVTSIGRASHLYFLIAAALAALLLIDALRAYQVSILNAERRQRACATIYAADAWARLAAVMICTRLFDASVATIILAHLVGAGSVVLISVLVVAPFGNNQANLSKKPSEASNAATLALTSKLERYALPLAPLALFGWVSSAGDRYIIGGTLGLDAAGLYAAAYGLASRPFFMLATVIELVMRPIMQRLIAERNDEATKRLQLRWIQIATLSSAAGVLSMFLLSEFLTKIFLGPAFAASSKLMPWVALGMAFYVVSTAYTRFCYAYDATKSVLWLTAGGALLCVIVMLPAIAAGGLFGAALSAPIYFGLQLVLAIALSNRAMSDFHRRASNKPIVSA